MRQCGEEGNYWWMVGVAVGEFHFDMENTTFIGSFGWASDVSVPDEEILSQWSCDNTNGGDLLVIDFLEVFG